MARHVLRRSSGAAGWAGAVAVALAAVWVTHASVPILERPYFFAAFPAVVAAALAWGAGPGLACVAVYTVTAAWLFLEPTGELSNARPAAVYRLALFAAAAVLVAALSGRLRTALRRERALREEAEREVAARAGAEAALRQTTERLAAVQGLTAALSAARTTDEIAAAVFRGALPLLGARAGSICVRTGPDELALLHSEGFAGDARRDYAVVPLSAPLPTADAARTGRAIWLGTAADIERAYPRLAEPRRRWGDAAWACVPMTAHGRTFGVLGLSYREERSFPDAERAFVASIAHVCAQAFARADLFDAERAARARAEAAEEEARRASAFQEQVLGVVGHDLRTPLSAILMATAAAQRAAVDERQSSALERIARSAARMSVIIRDLLDVSRARQGLGMTVSRQPISVAETCAHAVAELEAVHPGRHIRVVSDGEPRADADPSRLLQAVSNLVANALQHGARDDEVVVEVAGTATDAVVRVHNSGAPIPPEVLPAIFDPFRRAADGASSEGSVGLGLFIVREIARAHGGDVTVESTEDAGTTFTLSFPRAAHEPERAAAR
jgi:signal transduction histidine kinase